MRLPSSSQVDIGALFSHTAIIRYVDVICTYAPSPLPRQKDAIAMHEWTVNPESVGRNWLRPPGATVRQTRISPTAVTLLHLHRVQSIAPRRF